jgi:hypothetical protein
MGILRCLSLLPGLLVWTAAPVRNAEALQASPSIQVFMPDGSLPEREIRFKLITDKGRIDEYFTDSRGRFLFTRREGLDPNAGYTIIVESDRSTYDTTTVTFKFYQSTVFYVPIFLRPLAAENRKPETFVVDAGRVVREQKGRDPWSRKPYREWSEKEVLRMLNDSPWGQTQTVTDASNPFASGRRVDSGQSRVGEIPEINLRIRFLSARPVRQAISRLMELRQKGKISGELAQRLEAFAAADFPDYIVVTVSCESSAANSLFQETNALLQKLTTGDLQNSTYLMAKDGRRVFLQEYQPPREGLGAHFIFPRIVDGQPFLSPESGEVRFYSELANRLTVGGRPVFVNMRFAVKDMVFDGKLEY